MWRNKAILSVLLILIFNFSFSQNNKSDNFSFVVIPDRTGGFRMGVYEKAVEKINLLNPNFSVGIGDYVEGYTDDESKIKKEWLAFDSIATTLKAPFYKVPGNHDYTGHAQQQIWEKRFGQAYQHFIYKNCLFLLLNSNDGDGVNISQKQLNYFIETINKNKHVAWTFVFLHHPLWNYIDDKGFSKLEEQLYNSNYTVFAGHTHIYNYQERYGKDYITLATAGGSSDLRGKAFGELDHIAYVSFNDRKPAITQLALSGILDKDFTHIGKVAHARKIDSLSKIPITVLQNDDGDGGLYFQLRNSTSLPLTYQIDFLYQSFLSLSQNNIYHTVQPGKTDNIFVETKKIKPVSDSLRFIYKLQSTDIEIIKKTAIVYERNIPAIFSDTPVVFIDNKKINFPEHDKFIQQQYSLDDHTSFAHSNNRLSISEGGNLNLRLYHPPTRSYSASQQISLHKKDFLPTLSIKEKNIKKGLRYNYYEGVFSVLPDFSKLKSLKKGVALDFDVEKIMEKANNFAITYSGFVKIPQDGLYKILLTSDDGSKLNIHNATIVDNDGSHSVRTTQGYAALKKGFYPIDIYYFEDFDGQKLDVQFFDAETNKKLNVEYFHEP